MQKSFISSIKVDALYFNFPPVQYTMYLNIYLEKKLSKKNFSSSALFMVNGLVQNVKVNFYPSKKSVINNISLKEEIPSYFQPNYKEWFIDIRKGEN